DLQQQAYKKAQKKRPVKVACCSAYHSIVSINSSKNSGDNLPFIVCSFCQNSTPPAGLIALCVSTIFFMTCSSVNPSTVSIPSPYLTMLKLIVFNLFVWSTIILLFV